MSVIGVFGLLSTVCVFLHLFHSKDTIIFVVMIFRICVQSQLIQRVAFRLHLIVDVLSFSLSFIFQMTITPTCHLIIYYNIFLALI